MRSAGSEQAAADEPAERQCRDNDEQVDQYAAGADFNDLLGAEVEAVKRNASTQAVALDKLQARTERCGAERRAGVAEQSAEQDGQRQRA